MAKLCRGEIMSWYAFYVKTGKEDTLCRYLSYMLKGCEEVSCKLIIPKRELIEYKSGSKKMVYKPLFPGYILIHTDSIYKIYSNMKVLWHSEIYALIRTEKYFQKIKSEELSPLLKIINKDGIIKMSKIYLENDRVVVIDGALLHYSGIIKKINSRKGRAKISLDFFNCNYNFDIGVKCLDKLPDNELNREIVGIPMLRGSHDI